MDDNAFDITIIGTGLTESIIAAALSKAGLRILHIDTEANYGGTDASLTLIDLHHLLLSPPAELGDLSVAVPIPEALLQDSRNYAVSLAPSVVPSVGSLIDALVGSGVSRYVKFKLLDGVGLYAQTSDSTENEDGSSAFEVTGSVKNVPGSKEDVFKSKELGLLQKRKLMKFLMATAAQTDKSSDDGPNAPEVPFMKHLTSREVGFDAEVANAVAYALSLSFDTNETTASAMKRLRKYIRSTGRHGNSPFLIGHFGGAGEIAQGFCRAAAVAGATYILGRPFSITHANSDTSSTSAPEAPSGGTELPGHCIQLSFEGIGDVLTSRILISRDMNLLASLAQRQPDPVGDEAESNKRVARCIAILDGPVYFTRVSANENERAEREDEDKSSGIVDTAILIFPPGSLVPSTSSTPPAGSPGVITAFIAGPNSLACPDGKRIVYLFTEIPSRTSPEDALRPYLSAIQHLNRPKDDPSPVLTSLFYSQPIPVARASCDRSGPASKTTSIPPAPSLGNPVVKGLVPLCPPSYHLAEFADEAAEEAERVFWEVLGILGLDGRSVGGDGHTSVVLQQYSDGVEAGVKRVYSVGREGRDVEEGDGTGDRSEEVEKALVMWPKPVTDESMDDGW